MSKKSQYSIGILGGGQLARMMALKAHELGYQPYVLSSNKQDPAAQVTSFWTQGDIHSLSDLKKFIKTKDVVTFENEFINTSLLLKATKGSQVKIFPNPKTVEIIQDRWSQKNLLKKNNIPTASFVRVDSYEDLLKAFHLFDRKMVLKQRRFGYDGYGTFFIQSTQDCMKMKFPLTREIGFIAEAYIPFKRELAITLVSNGSHNIIEFPLVQTYQQQGICHKVKGPEKHLKARALILRLKKLVKSLKYKGAIAFEIFETSQGLIINELAPRVHNSAHYSLNALSQDQFTMHLLAVLNRPLKKPEMTCKGFAMMNLLGQKEKNTKWQEIQGVFLHDYMKQEKRSGRKMGHLNACASSPNLALRRLSKAIKSFS